MVHGTHQDDLRLVTEALADVPGSRSRLLHRSASIVWASVVALVGDGREGKVEIRSVMEALSAKEFAQLNRYDGRSSLATFLILFTREHVAAETAKLFLIDPNLAWRRFEKIFAAEIQRSIRTHFSRDPSRWDDLRQEVILRLIDQNYRRIRGYRGHGAFTAYIVATIKNIVIDLMRMEASRRRLPADVARQDRLHQAVFIAAAWKGAPLEVDRIHAALKGKFQPEPSIEDLQKVLDQLKPAIIKARDLGARPQHVSVDTDEGQSTAGAIADQNTPESELIEEEARQVEEAFLARISREAASLPGDERLYLQLKLQASEPLPPRDIARVMGVSVEQIYSLSQRTDRWVKRLASDARKTVGPSV